MCKNFICIAIICCRRIQVFWTNNNIAFSHSYSRSIIYGKKFLCITNRPMLALTRIMVHVFTVNGTDSIFTNILTGTFLYLPILIKVTLISLVHPDI